MNNFFVCSDGDHDSREKELFLHTINSIEIKGKNNFHDSINQHYVSLLKQFKFYIKTKTIISTLYRRYSNFEFVYVNEMLKSVQFVKNVYYYAIQFQNEYKN